MIAWSYFDGKSTILSDQFQMSLKRAEFIDLQRPLRISWYLSRSTRCKTGEKQ